MMSNKKNVTIAGVIGLLIAAYFGFDSGTKHQPTKSEYSSQQQSQSQYPNQNTGAEDSASGRSNAQSSNGLQQIRQAYDQKKSDIQVQASGKVKAILRDDNEGSRHQKFILSLDNGLTVLVAHNIDLSPRIENLKKGDWVEFNGEYEFSDQGGVIHWTHHDPQKRHIDGWLKFNGRTYQ